MVGRCCSIMSLPPRRSPRWRCQKLLHALRPSPPGPAECPHTAQNPRYVSSNCSSCLPACWARQHQSLCMLAERRQTGRLCQATCAAHMRLSVVLRHGSISTLHVGDSRVLRAANGQQAGKERGRHCRCPDLALQGGVNRHGMPPGGQPRFNKLDCWLLELHGPAELAKKGDGENTVGGRPRGPRSPPRSRRRAAPTPLLRALRGLWAAFPERPGAHRAAPSPAPPAAASPPARATCALR